ncbi:signal peptidase I [Chloroflexota bacterium]
MGCREIHGSLHSAVSSQMKELAKGIECNSTFDGLATEILGRGSCLRFRAHGNSMAPLIRNGGIVLVEPKRASELCIGDIVFYRSAKGRHIAHRLIDKSGNDGSLALTTKGDSQVHPDAPVFSKQVLGRVIRIEDQGKELRIGGRAGWVLNHLLLYASSGGGYRQGVLRRGLTKLWWLVGGKHK